MRIVLVLVAFPLCVVGAEEKVIHVASNAGEVRDGSAERPFATPVEAQRALRTRMASGESGPWAVSLAAGEYAISETFTFTPDDSGSPDAPVTWRGPADGSARIVGARELKGWRVRPDGRWEADVPIEKKHRFDTAVWFEQLYVNGRRAKRARYPNEGFLQAKGVKPTLLAGDTELMELFANGDDLAPLATCSFAHLRLAHLVVHHKWSASRRPIRGYDAARGVVFTEGRSVTKWNTWNAMSTYYVENAPFALDEPGEWLYDGVAKKVVYIPRPGETLETTRFQYPVPGLVNLLRIAGDPAKGVFVHDIVFENIDFAFSDSPRRVCFRGLKGLPTGEIGDGTTFGPCEWPGGQAAAHTSAAVLADGAHRIAMRGCSVAYAGEYGVWLREGCVSNRIERCSIVHPGAGGLRIGTTVPSQQIGTGERMTGFVNGRGTGCNVVEDCEIAHGGRIFAEGVGVWIGHSPFNSVTHCEIADFFYTGVSIGWVWGYAGSLAQGNTLAFCRIHDIGQGVLSDMGGVYTLGTSYGTCVTNNVVFNVDSRTYGGWGLYPDEGSEGIVFENNLVYDTKDASFHQHYGKDNVLRNNILAFSRQCQVALTRAEPHLSFTAERNIIYWNAGPVFAKYGATVKETGKIAWKGNIWWMESGAPSFNGKTFAEWQSKGRDTEGCVVDPLFVDVARRDFRLKPDSPVVKAGFRPFDISAAGVRKTAGRPLDGLACQASVRPGRSVYDLRCEYLAEPMGVVKPRFFWKWAGERPEKWNVKVWEGCSGFNTEAQRHGGAEVSDGINKIDSIDAGVVAQFETKEHLYVEPHTSLAPFTRFWWSVETPLPSTRATCSTRPNSPLATGTFVSGIEKWEKPFFKPPWKHDQKEYWIARKKVALKNAKSVIVSLASLGSHRLYVNGKPASDCFGPNRSHVEDGILLATTYDVTRLVKDGENEFKVYMHDGWAAMGQCKEKESCLSVDGRAVTESGTVTIDSAEPWDVSLSADRSYGPIGFNNNGRKRGVEHLCDVERETRQARGVLRTGPAFTVSCDVSDRDYAIREIKPVSIAEVVASASAPTGEKKWKIDMGEAFSGFMRLKLKGEKGTVARMTVSDTFVDECVFGQIAEFEFSGGDGVFENRMNTQSGRFFYLAGCEKPGLGDVTGIVIGCCGRVTGGFEGDKDLEKILALDRDTFIATTMGGVTVDCPHRERLGYGEASLSSMWGDGMPQFDSAAYYYAYLLKWASSQRPDGSIPHVSPNGYGWGGTFWSNFPVYALEEFCRRYPDERLKDVMRPVIDKWLDYLNSHVRSDGILEQYEPKKGDCLGDWLYPEIHKTKGTYGDWGHTVEGMFFNNCSYAWAIVKALATDGLVADDARRAELKRRHAALVKAIDREWYKDGLYVSKDARYQAIALVCGAAEAGGHRAGTEKAMQDIVEEKGYVDGGSPSYTVILRTLCTTRRGRELALKAFRRREAPGFLYFADEGYNTIPEDWWYGRKSSGSMIHTCYTGPAGAFFHGFAGIEIDGNRITVAPLLSDSLPNFSVYTETLYGKLSVKVETRGEKRIVTVVCPNGCEGTFVGCDVRHALHPGLNRFSTERN